MTNFRKEDINKLVQKQINKDSAICRRKRESYAIAIDQIIVKDVISLIANTMKKEEEAMKRMIV